MRRAVDGYVTVQRHRPRTYMHKMCEKNFLYDGCFIWETRASFSTSSFLLVSSSSPAFRRAQYWKSGRARFFIYFKKKKKEGVGGQGRRGRGAYSLPKSEDVGWSRSEMARFNSGDNAASRMEENEITLAA